MGFFQKKNCNHPVEDINGKFQGGRVKAVGIPGGTPKIQEKTWIFREVDAKNGKFQGGHDKFDWKSRESTTKKSISSTGGGAGAFFWKSPIFLSFLLYTCGF